MKTGLLTVKDQQNGEQTKMTLEELEARLK
jgi:hypothetical protein